MATLNCLYSETRLFDRVEFHSGINIILGRYPKSDVGTSQERSVNGIGKSTLVRLIDFMLLATPGRSALNPSRYPFLREHSVSLELTINSQRYKIVRSFDDPATVRFGRIGEEMAEYPVPEIREVLGNHLFAVATPEEGVYSSTWFRDLVRFFVKDDINRGERRTPVDFLHHRGVRKAHLMALNFFLLGLPNEELQEYDEESRKLYEESERAKGYERQIVTETGKTVSEFRTEAVRLHERIALLETSLQEFQFLETYKDVERRLEEISGLISQRLARYHEYQTILHRYQESYEVEIEVNVEEIQAAYEDLNRELAQFVRHTLESVIRFRSEIAANRRRFLVEKERELDALIASTLQEIATLESRRKRLYGLLQESGAFDSIRHAYEELIEQRVAYERGTEQLRLLQQVQSTIAQINFRRSQLVREIVRQIEASQEEINRLRSLYVEILERAIFVDGAQGSGFLDIKPDSEKAPPLEILVEIPKSASFGQAQFRLLAYDLTVFMHIVQSGRQLPHFLVHDGVFHGIARKTVVNVLNYIFSKSLEFRDLQYIVTGNGDEFEIPDSERSLYHYEFDFQDSVIVTYEAVPEKMIFRREF